MKPYVYKWTELSTGKWYIGSRTAKGCHPDDGYVCSSKIVRPLIQANPSDWRREILFSFDGEEHQKMTVAIEATLLQQLDAKNDPISYNRHNGDGVFSNAGNTPSEETKAKIGEAGRGKRRSEETKVKISAANEGKKRSEQQKAKMGLVWKGKKHSEETKGKISAAKKGKKLSAEHKAKLSETKKSYYENKRLQSIGADQ